MFDRTDPELVQTIFCQRKWSIVLLHEAVDGEQCLPGL